MAFENTSISDPKRTQVVAITSVDVTERRAKGMTSRRSEIELDLRYHVGGLQVTPAVGEHWMVSKSDSFFHRLVSKIPANAPEMNVEPQPGQVQVGSSGPLELHGSSINAHGPLLFQHYDIGIVKESCVLSLDNGNLQECTLSVSHSPAYSVGPETCVFTMPTMPAGATMTLIVKQPIVGIGKGRFAVGNASFPGVQWEKGVAPNVTPALRTADIFTFTSDGSNIYGSVTQGHIYHPPYEHAATLGPRRRKGSANPTREADGLDFWTPPDIARAYQLPDLDGTGVTVGCVQYFGPPSLPPLQAYVNYMGVDRTLDMEIIYLPGAEGQATNPDTWEAMLDMSVLTSMLPGAAHKVYQGVNDWQGFLDCIERALSECDVVSCSWYYVETWPWSESDWGMGLSFQLALEDILSEARSRDVSFFVASGDWGSDVWQPYGPDRMSWKATPRRLGIPANCPSAVSVGMTALHLDENGIRSSEEATFITPCWSTGGYSAVFPDTRCPVVSCFGEYMQGYAAITPSGEWNYLSSTSGSAPTMAAVHAQLIQLYGERFDFMDFALANPNAFFDITTGTNGAFNCHEGRDLVTGIGTPNGPALVEAITNWKKA